MMPNNCCVCEHCEFECGRLYCKKTGMIVSIHYVDSVDEKCPLIEHEDDTV